MNDYKTNWDNYYNQYFNNKVNIDNWLDKYQKIIDNSTEPIIDLGCGKGNNTSYLLNRNKQVIACDYSDIALKYINTYLTSTNLRTMQFDLSLKMPFNNSIADLIIADLSLHYFSKQTTINILNEIKRILKNNGYLLFRVNSTNDFNNGANSGIKLENNFFYTNGYNKRFFSEEDIYYFFKKFDIIDLNEEVMNRYEKPKTLWKCLVKNKEGEL